MKTMKFKFVLGALLLAFTFLSAFANEIHFDNIKLTVIPDPNDQSPSPPPVYVVEYYDSHDAWNSVSVDLGQALPGDIKHITGIEIWYAYSNVFTYGTISYGHADQAPAYQYPLPDSCLGDLSKVPVISLNGEFTLTYTKEYQPPSSVVWDVSASTVQVALACTAG